MQTTSAGQPAAADRAKSASIGPRTEAGKAISSQNARKHDLCSRTLRLSDDEWAEYDDMRDRYRRDLQPADDVEQTLIDEICFNYWRLQQAREIELDAIEEHPTDLRLIALYIRYRTGYERGFYKALDQIQKLQRERRKQTVQPRPVRSADSELHEGQGVTGHAEHHLRENRVRSAQHLESLPPIADLGNFVSQNSSAPCSQLLDVRKKVA